MEGIEFQEEGSSTTSSFIRPFPEQETEQGKMKNFLKKHKIAKNDAQAFYILFGVVIICIALSLFITWRFVMGPASGQLMVDPDVQMEFVEPPTF